MSITLLGTVLLGTVLQGSGTLWAQPGAAPSPVEVARVEQSAVAEGHNFVGTVMPARISRIGSAVPGRVVEFNVNEGDAVQAEQPLVQLRTRTLELELSEAEGELALRRAELAELENGSRPEEIEQARARHAALTALRDKFLSEYNRAKQLYERNAIGIEELERAQAEAESSLQNQIEAKAAKDLAEQGPRQERIEQARARVVSQEEVAKRLSDMITKHTIISPFDGYVVSEGTEIGQWVSQGEIVVEVAELSEVDVQVQVLEDYIQYVRIGGEARVQINSLPGETFVGHVIRIVPQADSLARTFPVKIRLENREVGGTPLIKAGMFAQATLPVGPETEQLLVPKDALVLGGPTPLVFVVQLDSAAGQTGTVRPVPVALGVADQGRIVVRGELTAGDLVVSQGNERLRPGQAVRLISVPPAT